MAPRISSWTYKRLVSVERFGNVSVEATVEFDAGDDPDEAFDLLRRQVDVKVLERKHRIEGTLADDREEDAPWTPAPKPPLGPLRTLPTPPDVAFIDGSQIFGGAISTLRVVNADGTEIARARSFGEPLASGIVVGSKLRAPSGGAIRATTQSGRRGTGTLTVYDAEGIAIHAYPVDASDVFAWGNDQAGDWILSEDFDNGGTKWVYQPSAPSVQHAPNRDDEECSHCNGSGYDPHSISGAQCRACDGRGRA